MLNHLSEGLVNPCSLFELSLPWIFIKVFYWQPEYLLTDSHNSCSRKGALEIICSKSPGATLSQLPRTMSRWLLNIFKDRDSTTSLGNSCQYLVTCQVFPDVQTELPMFQCVPITSTPVTGHHLKVPGFICFIPFLLIFIHIDEIDETPLKSSLLQTNFVVGFFFFFSDPKDKVLSIMENGRGNKRTLGKLH